MSYCRDYFRVSIRILVCGKPPKDMLVKLRPHFQAYLQNTLQALDRCEIPKFTGARGWGIETCLISHKGGVRAESIVRNIQFLQDIRSKVPSRGTEKRFTFPFPSEPPHTFQDSPFQEHVHLLLTNGSFCMITKHLKT